jgi:SIT family siderophore-iron:H+ symporter-like MFS transporter
MTPILAIPIILVLYKGTRPSRILRAEIRAARQADKKSFKTQALSLFWQLDTIGLVLCVLGFGLFFVTITIANGPTSEWSDRKSPFVSAYTTNK